MNTILVRFGEIALKGKNIRTFEKQLSRNVKQALSHIKVKIIERHSRLFVECEEEDFLEVCEVLTSIPGIFSISPAIKVPNDIEAIKEMSLLLVKEINPASFKVEARRALKHFPITSPEIARVVGGHIFENIEGLRVDLHEPELVLSVEVRDITYIFVERISGLGGMPYKSAGKALSLLSGGIDSPVASFLMAKRGLEIVALHFHSFPFTSQRAMEKVMTLAQKLTKYTYKIKFLSINLAKIQQEIAKNCPASEMTILSRCFMMLLAKRVAEKEGAKSLVTGESLGQVASQTLESIAVTDSYVDMPVFRPLIAFDKSEIIKIAQEIDTFETSILPFEDCCTVFLPEEVVTKPRLDRISESLGKLEVQRLIDEALDTLEETTLYYREK